MVQYKSCRVTSVTNLQPWSTKYYVRQRKQRLCKWLEWQSDSYFNPQGEGVGCKNLFSLPMEYRRVVEGTPCCPGS